MKAFLKKFEPLEDGTITVTLKVNGDDMNDVVRLYRKDVSLSEPITPGGDSVPTEIVTNSLMNIQLMITSLLNTINPGQYIGGGNDN